MRKTLLVLTLSFLACALSAQDSLQSKTLQEVVVTGTKFELPTEKSGKIIFKVTDAELNRNPGKSVADILNEIPGIHMDGNYGAPGTNLSYFVRGGRNRHSLIYIDGIPMVDPSGIEPFFDLRFLALNQIENIEIMQGSLSTLYGSGAAASVISIQTVQSLKNGIHGGINLEAGTWKSFGQGLNINGRKEKASFVMLANNYSSAGFSSAQKKNTNDNFDKDGFKRKNLLMSAGYDFTPHFTTRVFTSYDWFDNQYDAGPFMDANNSQAYDQMRLGIKNSFKYANGSLEFLVQRTISNREEKGSYQTKYEGNNWFSEIIHKQQITPSITILSGISVQRLSYNEKSVNEKDTTAFTIIDPYLSLLSDLKRGVTIHAGVRLNTHSAYGPTLIYNINPSWQIELSKSIKVKMLTSISTAYITPTLFQLHTIFGGNISLKPEEDLSFEYGATFYWKDKLQFTAINYFRNEKHAIGYSPAFQYINVGSTRYVHGITMEFLLSPINTLNLKADYAYVNSNQPATFYRIPSHKAGFSSSFDTSFGSTFSLHYQYIGHRSDLYYDSNFDSHKIIIKEYTVLDLTVSQTFLKEQLMVYFSVANLLNKDFVAVYGYTTRGRNYLIGMKFSF